jgi:hypothetical protein
VGPDKVQVRFAQDDSLNVQVLRFAQDDTAID